MIEDTEHDDLNEVISEDPYWREQALCVDPAKWFPEPGQHSLEARAICLKECPVKAQCLATAFKTDEHFGIWGGLTVSALRKARRERSRAIRAGSPPNSVDHYLGVARSELDQRVEDTWDQSDIELHEWAEGTDPA